MMVRLAIRGYLGKAVQFEERLEVEQEGLGDVLPALGLKHAAAMADGKLGMIELEFLDEPDRNQRFFRIGVDPSGMVMPICINLEGNDA
jgi:hypothetical protein